MDSVGGMLAWQPAGDHEVPGDHSGHVPVRPTALGKHSLTHSLTLTDTL